MLRACLFVALVAQPGEVAAPVKFDALTRARAEQLDGCAVTITFTVARPAYTWGEGANLRTVTGPADVDDAERTVVLKGDRLKDVDAGAKLKVSGVLRVIRHPPVVVGGQLVEAWTEVRVEE